MESPETPHSRRRAIRRITSDDEEDTAEPPPSKKARLASSPPSEASTSRNPYRAKPRRKKASNAVVSEPDSDEFDAADEPESELDLPMDDDDGYMSEPKSTGKRAGGRKTKAPSKGGKGKDIKIMARDERKKRPADSESAGTPASKRSKTKLGDVLDVVGDLVNSPPVREDAAPPKKKLPTIKKNKPGNEPSTVGPPAASTPAVATKSSAPPRSEEDSKLPLPMVAARKQPVGPQSVDLDLSNPTMYAQLFNKSGVANSTSSGFSRRDKEEERRKELNKMRDEARAKRLNEAMPPFDLQGQTDKIIRFEEKLRMARSPAVYPNHLAGGLKQMQGKTRYSGNDPLEEGEM
ncbi:hypothetical protein C8F01DRAFT_70648 [Mycena amicta]|nr:hypothetical protein C8F01DRAFT_70648 [Mycena amicta]